MPRTGFLNGFYKGQDTKGGYVGLQVVRSDERTPRKMLAAVYSRVSTVGLGQDPNMQTRELVEYCQRRGWEIYGCYTDEGVSGKKDSRPQLNRLMADAHARRFDVVVVWRFDRFARSIEQLVLVLADFRTVGIDFVIFPGSPGHQQANGQGHVHNHRRDGGTGAVSVCN